MTLIVIGACLLLSALFSGSETGIYTLSRPRLDLLSAAGGAAPGSCAGSFVTTRRS